MEAPLTGGCLCGAVRYAVHSPLTTVTNCHCGQCRRFSGHFGAYTGTDRDGVELLESSGLKWYASSEIAERGFCGVCGSSLFWRARTGNSIAILPGTLDGPTGLRTVAHIYTAFAGDYYQIDDDLRKLETE
ncbi:GFA family protein [Gloeobacter kilaueensis]|uniref:CENP-V/GFA domain-containing protein n=1 Tax=Gloeobacter kilaueensis (strain ATCC BAA-2537 / CCAP 1431/1 / ULC 316 / JS1) TaxID=1183438 RepID=U5QJ17_GLOK1|nr:GFA family protein [Gloeobacter kilaueensis]AGY58901.1 hypothetical protein GKIL_2655 [Gloeobacter kilaueensis JS1]